QAIETTVIQQFPTICQFIPEITYLVEHSSCETSKNSACHCDEKSIGGHFLGKTIVGSPARLKPHEFLSRFHFTSTVDNRQTVLSSLKDYERFQIAILD